MSVIQIPSNFAGRTPSTARAQFIRRTYAHLAGAIAAFAALEVLFFKLELYKVFVPLLSGRWSWLLVMGAFMGISHLANKWASSDTSQEMQYLGLGLYVFAEAIIFVPLLYVAAFYSDASVIPTAGVITVGLFAALTTVVFTTKADFSFLGSVLKIGGWIALGTIVAGILFGFQLGTFFAAIMVAFAGGAILYETSNLVERYNPNQHVAASLSLFASVALLFWYVLRVVMGSRGRD